MLVLHRSVATFSINVTHLNVKDYHIVFVFRESQNLVFLKVKNQKIPGIPQDINIFLVYQKGNTLSVLIN